MNVLRKDLKPGMVLSESIKDRTGKILLLQGTVLNPALIDGLQKWGILRVEIEGDAEMLPDSQRQHKMEESDLRFLFQHTNLRHPFMAVLFEQCMVRLNVKSSSPS